MKFMTKKNVKKLTHSIGFTLLIASSVSNAGLINRGSGLIYDDVLDVTWLQNANLMQTSDVDTNGQTTWQGATEWADNLVFEGYDDWRLPTNMPVDGSNFDFGFSFDGSTDRGFNSDTSANELAYMFHINLNNISYFDTLGNAMQAGSEVFNSSFTDVETGELFTIDNILPTYWSKIGNDPIVNAAWAFAFYTQGIATGEAQLLNVTANNVGAWALRDGDVFMTENPPPVQSVGAPATLAILCIGLIGLVGGRKDNLYLKSLRRSEYIG